MSKRSECLDPNRDVRLPWMVCMGLATAVAIACSSSGSDGSPPGDGDGSMGGHPGDGDGDGDGTSNGDGDTGASGDGDGDGSGDGDGDMGPGGGSGMGDCGWGEQDFDGDGVCRPDCAALDLQCGADKACDDSSGIAVCACETGYQDHDDDGSCAPSCDEDSCGADASCDDSSGAVVCLCGPGFVEAEEGGECLSTCDAQDPGCSGEGSYCDDSMGEAVCMCESGFQDKDGDGACENECSTASLSCGENEECSDLSGVPTCICSPGTYGHPDSGGCTECTGDCSSCVAGVLPLGVPVQSTTEGAEVVSLSSCAIGNASPGLTYSFAAPEAGLYQLTTRGSDFDTVLGLSAGNSCTAEELICNDDAMSPSDLTSRVIYSFEAGEAVLVTVSGATSTESGGFELLAEADACLSAVDLDSALGSAVGESSAGEASAFRSYQCGLAHGSPEHYFTWTAPSAGTYRFTTDGSDYDTVLWAIAGCDSGSQYLGCNDDYGDTLASSVFLELEANETIVLGVDGWETVSGQAVLNVSEVP